MMASTSPRVRKGGQSPRQGTRSTTAIPAASADSCQSVPRENDEPGAGFPRIPGEAKRGADRGQQQKQQQRDGDDGQHQEHGVAALRLSRLSTKDTPRKALKTVHSVRAATTCTMPMRRAEPGVAHREPERREGVGQASAEQAGVGPGREMWWAPGDEAACRLFRACLLAERVCRTLDDVTASGRRGRQVELSGSPWASDR